LHFSAGIELKLLSLLASACAVLAGAILTLITLITCASLIGRNTIGVTLVGDYELTAAAAGAAVALFLPWCQIKRENIIVDFFTAKLSAVVNRRLDRVGTALLAGVMLLLTWRTAVGCLGAFRTQSTTMMLGFPEWIVYAAIVPPLALTGLIALFQTFFGDLSEQGQ
jgi:TRAP-type C4-dicarboxylate transport system permease small subunit